MCKSLLLSADMAHAIHPNYSDKHEDHHRPQINGGVVIKTNANQRYASTSVTSLILKQLAVKANVPVQEFVVRNDSACGSTIGPMLSSKLGLRTVGKKKWMFENDFFCVDLGNPQWSMHSIRETCGVDDVGYAAGLFKCFYENFVGVAERVDVD